MTARWMAALLLAAVCGTATAQPRLPRGFTDITLGASTPRAYKKAAGALPPERFLIPLPKARVAAKDLLGPDWRQAIDGGWFSTRDDKVAEIGLSFEAMDFRAAKAELTEKYGPAVEKVVSGEGLCSDVRVAEWHGSEAWMLLAVTGRNVKSDNRGYSQLVLRSPALYTEFKRNRWHPSKVGDPACHWQQW